MPTPPFVSTFPLLGRRLGWALPILAGVALLYVDSFTFFPRHSGLSMADFSSSHLLAPPPAQSGNWWYSREGLLLHHSQPATAGDLLRLTSKESRLLIWLHRIGLMLTAISLLVAAVLVWPLRQYRQASWLAGLSVLVYGVGFYRLEPLSLLPTGWDYLCLASILGGQRYLDRTFTQRAAKGQVLIVFASQSGTAARIARQMQRGYPAAQLSDIAHCSARQLVQYRQVLFVVSTQGVGQPPESATGFIYQLSQQAYQARHTECAILALGDRQYQDTFCAFGHQLADLLTAKGFALVESVTEIDRADPDQIQTWWDNLQTLLPLPKATLGPRYQSLQVSHNTCLNPTNPARALHHIRLTGLHGPYQPGDLLAVRPVVDRQSIQARLARLGWPANQPVRVQGQPVNLLDALCLLDWTEQRAATPQQLVDQLNPLAERRYSIASASHGEVALLVRQHFRADHSPGTASYYLCNRPPGESVQGYIQHHHHFRLVGDTPLIMLAAGTGLAPFIGFLAAKAHWHSQQYHWLLFGEQHRHQDNYLQQTLQQHQQSGLLDRVDYAWSRDEGLYLQDVAARHQQAMLHILVEQQGHIYVCGRLQGFGQGIQALLESWPIPASAQARIHYDLY